MATLPGGFSPVNAIKQTGSFLNPTGGVSDYDVFSEMGSQNNYAENGWVAQDPSGINTTDAGRALLDSINFQNATNDVVSGFNSGGLSLDNPNSNYDSSLGSGGSAGGAAAPSAQDLAYLDQQRSLYERLLSDVDKFQNNALGELKNNYTLEKNRANRNRSRALEDYQTQRSDTQSDKSKALNQVDTNSRTLYDSLRKVIGGASGTGSSAFLYAAPNAVARVASGERGDVMENYGENMRSLVTAEDRAKTDFELLLEDLARQRSQNERALRTGFDTERQTINDSLASIAAERASLMGGNELQATAPYREAYMSLQDKITGYPDQFSTTVNPQAINVDPVNLRDYTVDRQAINANRNQGQSVNSPYAQFLTNKRKKEDER